MSRDAVSPGRPVVCERCGAPLSAEIDISRLAPLDQRGASSPRSPPAARSGATALPSSMFAPPPEARAPRTSPRAMAPPIAASDLPSQAFAPPPEDLEGEDQELAVERSTRAIRIAKEFQRAQAPAAAAPSRRSASQPRAAPLPSSSRGLVLAVALVAVVLVAILAIMAR